MRRQEIVGSRSKALLRLAISVGFTLIGLWMVRSPEANGWAGWMTLTLFGLAVPIFGWTMIRPQRLILDVQGFVLSGGFVRSPRHVRWCDITGFFIYRLPRGGKMIGYNYVDSVRPATVLSRVNHRLGVDAVLPKAWAGRPEQIAAELNEFRTWALGGFTPPA